VDIMSREWIVSNCDERLSLNSSASSSNLQRSKSLVDHIKYYSDTFSIVMGSSVNLVGGQLDKKVVMKMSIDHHRNTSVPADLKDHDHKTLEKKTRYYIIYIYIYIISCVLQHSDDFFFFSYDKIVIYFPK
jgi:hypothetical protein